MAAFGAALYNSLPFLIKIAIALGILASFAYQLYLHRQPKTLVWRTGNRWFVPPDNTAAELVEVNFISRWLVIITLRESAKRGPLGFHKKTRYIIPLDSLDAKRFRLLRVRLRVEAFECLNPSEPALK